MPLIFKRMKICSLLLKGYYWTIKYAKCPRAGAEYRCMPTIRSQWQFVSYGHWGSPPSPLLVLWNLLVLHSLWAPPKLSLLPLFFCPCSLSTGDLRERKQTSRFWWGTWRKIVLPGLGSMKTIDNTDQVLSCWDWLSHYIVPLLLCYNNIFLFFLHYRAKQNKRITRFS